MSTQKDLYPSRGGATPALIERMDPVIHTDDTRRQRAPIDPALLSNYEKNGFMLLDGIFSDSEIELFRAELERLRNDPSPGTSDEVITEPDSGAIRTIFRVHARSALFAGLVADRRLAGLARYILGDEVYVHQSRLNYKPGFRGREFYWHSDFETWHVEDGMPRMRALSMSIILTENTPYNGPLMLIPGSHREYAICSGTTPENHYRRSLKRQEYGIPDEATVSSLIDRGGIYTATARAGSVIVFDCNTMHGSNSNITPLPRSNVFFVYNSISNRIGTPYCQRPPRPDFIANRNHIEPIAAEQLPKSPMRSTNASDPDRQAWGRI